MDDTTRTTLKSIGLTDDQIASFGREHLTTLSEIAAHPLADLRLAFPWLTIGQYGRIKTAAETQGAPAPDPLDSLIDALTVSPDTTNEQQVARLSAALPRPHVLVPMSTTTPTIADINPAATKAYHDLRLPQVGGMHRFDTSAPAELQGKSFRIVPVKDFLQKPDASPTVEADPFTGKPLGAEGACRWDGASDDRKDFGAWLALTERVPAYEYRQAASVLRAPGDLPLEYQDAWELFKIERPKYAAKIKKQRTYTPPATTHPERFRDGSPATRVEVIDSPSTRSTSRRVTYDSLPPDARVRLTQILAGLYSTAKAVGMVCESIGVPCGMLDLQGSANIMWSGALRTVDNYHGCLDMLLAYATREYQHNEGLDAWCRTYVRPADAPLVYLAYAHPDADMVNRFTLLASSLVRNGTARLFDSNHLPAGTRRHEALTAAVQEAAVVLAFVSADFYGCDDAMRFSQEARRLGKLVVPVILRPIGDLPHFITGASPLPSNGRPVSGWGDKDAALLDVLNGLRRALP